MARCCHVGNASSAAASEADDLVLCERVCRPTMQAAAAADAAPAAAAAAPALARLLPCRWTRPLSRKMNVAASRTCSLGRCPLRPGERVSATLRPRSTALLAACCPLTAARAARHLVDGDQMLGSELGAWIGEQLLDARDHAEGSSASMSTSAPKDDDRPPDVDMSDYLLGSRRRSSAQGGGASRTSGRRSLDGRRPRRSTSCAASARTTSRLPDRRARRSRSLLEALLGEVHRAAPSRARRRAALLATSIADLLVFVCSPKCPLERRRRGLRVAAARAKRSGQALLHRPTATTRPCDGCSRSTRRGCSSSSATPTRPTRTRASTRSASPTRRVARKRQSCSQTRSSTC